jgi:hypothetical protein
MAMAALPDPDDDDVEVENGPNGGDSADGEDEDGDEGDEEEEEVTDSEPWLEGPERLRLLLGLASQWEEDESPRVECEVSLPLVV